MSIDAALGRLGIQTGVCTSSTRPANPYEGQVIFETDTNNLRFWSGSAWESNKGAVISSAAPSSPAAGDIWYDSDDGRAYVYYDDGTSAQWVEFGAPPVQHGKILQAVSTLKTDTYTTTSSTFTTVTGLTATITPSSTASKVLIIAQVNLSLANFSAYARLSGGNTSTYLGDAASNRVQSVVAIQADTDNPFGRTQFSVPLIYLDSPSTTSSTTYGVDVRIGTGAVYVNRSQDDTDSVNNGRTASTITVMEVSA